MSLRLRIYFLLIAVLYFGSGVSAFADNPPNNFVSLDSLPGRHHNVELRSPPKFLSLRGRAVNMAGLNHTVRRTTSVPVQTKDSASSTALPPKPVSTHAIAKPQEIPAPLTKHPAKTTNTAMTQESARQILSIFPSVD